jgi:hypothetical protein
MSEVEHVKRFASVVHAEVAERYARLVVRTTRSKPPSGWEVDRVTIEELVLAYLLADC